MLMYEYTYFFKNKFSSLLAKLIVPIYCNVTLCFWYNKYTRKKSGVFAEPVGALWKTLS